MAKDTPYPGFFRRREMLDAEGTFEKSLGGQGAELAAHGLLDEALTFYVRAGDTEGMERILRESREAGDTFSFDAALRALNREVARDEWGAVGRKALEEGKLWFAYRAFEKADDQDGLETVRAAMGKKDIPTPT